MPATKTLAAVFLLTGLAVANPLTTLEVCPAAATKVPACTVTAQHQSVSTCIPTATKGTSTGYSYSTWAYVSTVIPCGYDGKTISSCTVTKTDQAVPCSASATTITSIVPIATGFLGKNGTNATTSYSTSYQTISKQWAAPYNKLGPLAIPGYDGCSLCADCAVKGDGSRSQFYNVTECTSGNGKAASCQNYAENRVSSKSATASSTAATATNSMKTSVSSQGTYTFTFTNTAPAATITSDGQKTTVPPQPWFNYETRSCQGPTNFDFTVTVTKIITNYVPLSTSTDASKTPVDPTNAMAWGNWNGPAATPAMTTPASSPTGPTGASFVIPVNSGSGSKYSPKSSNQWVGFPSGGDDGAVVSSQGDAAQFYYDSEGNLMCDGQYITTSTGSGYLVFEKGGDKPSGPKFSTGSDGSFTLPGAGFCYTDSTFFITFSGGPSGCKPVTCSTDGGNAFTTSSTTTTVNTWTDGWGQWASATSTTFATSTSYVSTTASTSTASTSTGYTTSTGTVSTSTGYTTSTGTVSTSTGYTTSTSTGSTSTGSTPTSSASTSTATTTTYSYTTTSTTPEYTTTTTTTWDKSADLDFPEPTAKPVPRKRGGLLLRKRTE